MSESLPLRQSPTVFNNADNFPHVVSAPNIDGKRASKTLTYLEDYYCNLSTSGVQYPLSKYMSYGNLSTFYRGYICSIKKYAEPSFLLNQENQLIGFNLGDLFFTIR